MTEVMKPWQKGIGIDDLKEALGRFERYNKLAYSPFTEINKPEIARAIDAGELKTEYYEGLPVAFLTKTAKRDGTATLVHGQKVRTYQKGDEIISRFSPHADLKDSQVADYLGMAFGPSSYRVNVWISVWSEDLGLSAAVQNAGAKYVYPKYYSTGEIARVYVFENAPSLEPIETVQLDAWADVGITKVRLSNDNRIFDLIDPIGDALGSVTFKNHYSNYNKGKAWGAVAIRGYDKDPSFIEKPTEVANSKKWAASVADKLDNKPQDTDIAEFFPSVKELLEPFLGGRTYDDAIERVRLMKLKPGGGELLRHTDQQDADSGLADGKIARFHFPIVTNPDVKFTSWHHRLGKVEAHMDVGHCYYLDVRKPHSAINGGTEDRVHLVVDVVSNAHVRQLVANSLD